MHPYVHNLLTTFSLVLYIYDIGSDIALAISYAANNDNWYFGLTLAFTLLPLVITNIASSIAVRPEHGESDVLACVRPMSHFCLMGMVYRYVGILYDGCKNPKLWRDASKRRNININAEENPTDHGKTTTETSEYTAMTKKTSDVGQLAVLEAFLEAAPQLVLQLYIVITNAQVIRPEFQTYEYKGISKRNVTAIEIDDQFFRKLSHTTTILQISSIGGSILSMAWALTNNNKNLRLAANSRDKLPWKGIAIYFFWHLFTVAARVLVLALFASAFTYWTYVVESCRVLVMSCGIFWVPDSKHEGCWGFWKNVLRGLFFTFTFVTVIKEAKKKHCLYYFIYELVEDSVLIGLWCWVVDPIVNKFFYLAVGVHYGCVGLGFVFMMVYFKYYPANNSTPVIEDNNRPNEESIALNVIN